MADCLHFSRAAEMLGMAQPSLSQQIRKVEDEIGVELFSRSSRGVQLTSEGVAFLPGARRAVAEAERAVQAARDVRVGRGGHIIIGGVSSALVTIVPSALSTLRRWAPEVTATVLEMNTPDQLVALDAGRIDIGFLRLGTTVAGLKFEVLLEEPLLAALPRGHPLAEEASVELRRLADEPFVLWPLAMAWDLYGDILAACRRHGFTPRIAWECIGAAAQLGGISAGLGVALVPATFSSLRHAGVIYRPLKDPDAKTSLILAWRLYPSSTVSSFVECCRPAAGSRVAGSPFPTTPLAGRSHGELG